MRIHNVFHVSKLRKYVANDNTRFPARGQVVRPAPDIVDEEEEWEVERILNKKVRKYRNKVFVRYLVLWKGYPEWEATWERSEHLKHSETLIKEYEDKH